MAESESVKRERLRLNKLYKTDSLTTWHGTKTDLSHKWIEDAPAQKGRLIQRGGVYMCHLGDNVGDEQGKHRPVIVVSNDLINTTSGNVSVVPLTTTLKKQVVRDRQTGRVIRVLDKPRLRSQYFIKKSKYNFLDDDSAVVGEEVKTVSKVRIGTHKGNISDPDLNRILQRIEWVIGLR